MLLCISIRLLSLGSCGFISILDIHTAVQQHNIMPILSTINEPQQSLQKKSCNERMLFQTEVSNSMTFPKPAATRKYLTEACLC